MILPFKCHLLLEPIQMSFANGAHSNVSFLGDSQEILRRFSRDSQEILRRCSGDPQEIHIDFQEWNDSPIQMSFTIGAHSNAICNWSPFKCHLQMKPIQM